MTNARGRRNDRARTQIASIIATTRANGGRFMQTIDILEALKYRYRGYNSRHVGSLLKERNDVKWISRGLWAVL